MNKHQIRDNYKNNIDRFSSELKKLNSAFMTMVYLRLLVFIATSAGIYYLWDLKYYPLIIGIIGITIFIFLVKKAIKLSYEKKYFKSIITINEWEIDSLNGTYHQFPEGNQFVNPQHNYSYDIDLFGTGSFFQYMNRCQTSGGKTLLAIGLTEPNFEIINDRQKAIQELSENLDWNQQYITTASLIDTEINDDEVTNWIQSYTSILPKLFRYLLFSFPIVSLIVLVSVYLGYLPIQVIYINLLIGLGVTGVFIKRVNAVHDQSSRITNSLKQYAEVLKLIENKTFSAPMLQEIQLNIQEEGRKASDILNQLYRIFDTLDQRSNILIAIVLNGLFLSDLRAIHRLDKWMEKYQTYSVVWFNGIYQFDELISCGIYRYNHPNTVFPLLDKQGEIIEVKQLGHPLISDEKRINNDYQLTKEHFSIITGANMAGKSTFLRAIGLNISLANHGMPVTASYMNYRPIKLISSMRTTDSLNKEESYFFSELKRLKYIVDQCKTDRYFIILDEILKGTNSKDKAEGSKKFLEKMRLSGSSGIIATHDLSLCELSTTYDSFNNKYFDAEIVNDELFFDYTLKEGQCVNMNASFLLKKMEII